MLKIGKSKRVLDATTHYITLFIIAFVILFPFFWMIMISLKPAEEIMQTNIIPTRFEWSNYRAVWQSLPLLRYLRNSVFISIMTTIFCLILAIPAGYSLSRYRSKLAKVGLMMFVFSQLIPSVLPFIAYYFIMFNLGLNNTYFGLIGTYSVWGIPFCILMMRGYFKTAIPDSLVESGTIDGCSKYGVFFKIALPISIPGVVSTAIFSFVVAWNEFMFASVMLTNSQLKPISVGVFDFVGQHGTNASMALVMATAVISTVPVMILFGFLQKYLISGLAAGAVKG
jgi:ABC-type glycerol-3-phosphate transport system permease component